MVMHSAIYRMLSEAEPIPSCPQCHRYMTNYPEGLRCTYCEKEQATTRYIIKPVRDGLYVVFDTIKNEDVTYPLRKENAEHGATNRNADDRK